MSTYNHTNNKKLYKHSAKTTNYEKKYKNWMNGNIMGYRQLELPLKDPYMYYFFPFVHILLLLYLLCQSYPLLQRFHKCAHQHLLTVHMSLYYYWHVERQ